jgi:Domain of unknown function (DUF4263)
MTKRYHLDSDSQSSARVDPIDLWTSEDATRRLAFLPHIHQNPHDPSACISGQLRYQRKSSGGEFVDEHSLRLSDLRNGEWTRYALCSGATLALFRSLSDLYEVYATQGPPRRETTILAVEGDFSAEVDALGDVEVGLLLGALMRRAARTNDLRALAEALSVLETESLDGVRTAAGIANLRAALDQWPALESENEPAWQSFLKTNSWILGQAFAQPVLLFRSGATVRPEDLAQADRQIVDYVYANSLTSNLALVEIKKPAAPLLASRPYRDSGIYQPSGELTGAVSQICAYRHSVKQHASTLLRSSKRALLRSDPQCIVVIGSMDSLDEQAKVDSFEQFRRELRGVEVLTFDELKARAEGILGLLTTESTWATRETVDTSFEDVPF